MRYNAHNDTTEIQREQVIDAATELLRHQDLQVNILKCNDEVLSFFDRATCVLLIDPTKHPTTIEGWAAVLDFASTMIAFALDWEGQRHAGIFDMADPVFDEVLNSGERDIMMRSHLLVQARAGVIAAYAGTRMRELAKVVPADLHPGLIESDDEI